MRVVLPASSQVTIAADPLELLPVLVSHEWLRDRAGASSEELPTELGWPAWAVTLREGDGWLVRAYFRFLDYGALVEARARSPELARALLAQARPDWSGETAALCQVFGC